MSALATSLLVATPTRVRPQRRRLSAKTCMLMAGGALFAEPALAEDKVRLARLSANHVSDIFANVDGGIDRGTALLGKTGLMLDVGEAAFGVGGMSAFVDLQYVWGRSLSGDLVGDGQTASNIEAISALRPLEAWAQWASADEAALVRAGLIDLNGLFDVQEVGQLFINSSHGIGPEFSQSGLNGPSIFPTTAAGVAVEFRDDGWGARFGLFDAVAGDPDRPTRTLLRFPGDSGALLVGEVDVPIAKAAKVRIGGWSYSTRFDGVAEMEPDGSPRRLRKARGGYAMVEGRIAGDEDGPGLDGWLRLGIASKRVHPIHGYLGGGIAYGTEERRVGIAVAHARLGRPAMLAGDAFGNRPKRAETNIELSYSHALSDRIRVQPDVQYIVNPGWVAGRADALLVGARVEISLF